MSKIGVVDCNNFFVSCERLFRPDLQRKPVAVLSSNDGCIVARSQEVKDMNVPMGVPYFKVKDIIKDNEVTLFSSHFTLYRDVSRRVFLVLRDILQQVEQYSIDEAFFVVPDELSPEEVAREIKDRIEQQVGVPVSVGIGASKTQAKYAVELAKKADGVRCLSSEDWQEQTQTLKLSAIWGVGLRSYRHYEAAGYHTVADLLGAEDRRVQALFGVHGQRLKAELAGEAVLSVETKLRDQKSMMSTRSFKEITTDKAVLEDAIAYHTRHIAADLRAQNAKTTVVRITIQASRYSDFLLQGASLEAVLDVPTNDTFTLLKTTQTLLQNAFTAGVPYKKAGVIASGLVSALTEQGALFGDAATVSKHTTLLQLMDTLNTKADRELITLGERRRGDNWQARKDAVSPSYTTKWTDVATVKA